MERLNEKIETEFFEFKAYMLSLSKNDILNLSYTYYTIENIYMYFKSITLNKEQIEKLLKVDNLLAEIKYHYDKLQSDLWNDLEMCVSEVLA